MHTRTLTERKCHLAQALMALTQTYDKSLEILIELTAVKMAEMRQGEVCKKCKDGSICEECPFNIKFNEEQQ